MQEEQNTPEAVEATADDNKETTPSLEEMLRLVELKAEEHHDAWLRAKAETENVRRRGLEEVDKARKFAVEKFAGELLAVKDSLEAALATGDSATLESLKSGVELTLRQLASVFEKQNLLEIDPLGQKFDPNLHQAIGMVEGEGEANTVAAVLQKGYLLNERVLRPAMVQVFK
ncbi:MAG: nucleotide exchange factor GrpE [Betaproteobacteria bacterium]|nr:nucleotide exchange factor GrpE [Betaproteobacteria bacterium]